MLTAAVSLTACNRKNDSTSLQTDIKLQQYYVPGEQLYAEHCSNCHQQNGTGLGLLFPPVNKSDFVDQQKERVLCLMRHGIAGELVVNGKSYNKTMPPQPRLTDLEIAQIATYIYNSWGRSEGIVDVRDASKILQACDSLRR